MPGPAPKPTKLKLLEGNPGHQKLNKEEIDCEVKAAPEPPIWLDPIAAMEYTRIYPLLTDMGLLTAIDSASLEAYCDAYSSMVRFAIVVNTLGASYVTEGGQVRARPEAQLKIQAANAVRQFSQEFGLSPAARSRLNVKDDGGKELSDMEKFLSKAKAQAQAKNV